VAKDRRISVEDKHMGHGRKSPSTLVDGDKRHVLTDLDSGLVCAVGITPANAPQATVTDDLAADLAAHDPTLVELRQRQQTPQGRARLRERTKVEHSPAHIGHWQGPRARYLGPRKNLFDLRRAAVVHNLHVIARQPPGSQQTA
jgi:hypothetical protein